MKPDRSHLGALCADALNAVLGPRNDDYGRPSEDMAALAQMVTGLLHRKLSAPITPEEAALLLVCVKLSRECNRPKRDNRLDAIGYLLCAEDCVEAREPYEAVGGD